MGREKSLTGLKLEDRQKICPDCGAEVIYESGELYCKKCGLVID